MEDPKSDLPSQSSNPPIENIKNNSNSKNEANPSIDPLDKKNDDHFKQFNIDYSKDMEKEEEFEILKLKDPNVHVFELPPMMSVKGHLAADFTKLVFKGMMKMTVKGEFMYIYFLNPNNTIFCVSIVDYNYEKFILPTDSSRYFSIRAMNPQGVPNWYGLAFKQRNPAFDFKKTLMDFKEQYLFEKKLKENEGKEYKPKYDFSLGVKKQPEKKPNNFAKFKFGPK